MIKFLFLFFLVLGILYMYCKISNKEAFDNYVSELHCIDSCIMKHFNENNDKHKMNDYNTQCKNECETNCRNKNCSYYDILNLKKSPPGKILNERVVVNKDNIHITWFKPKTSIEHPVLRYICVIENDNDKSVEIEIPNLSNTDLIEHYMRGLKKNTFYNIKIYSENDNGLSHPVILKRVSIRNKDEEQTHQKQVRLKGYTSWKKLYQMSVQKNRITRFILKLLK
jgi:hypothetical protein